ncbi:hypothetical protein FQA39_LY10150 [Lamprigera yunnana]|nr:hypothetical protein FQA39_LY10150 [Lamprigera yunnana]
MSQFTMLSSKLKNGSAKVRRDLKAIHSTTTCKKYNEVAYPSESLRKSRLFVLADNHGLYYPFEFAYVVKIFGRSKQYVIFKEKEWTQFHEQRVNINKYFQTCDMMRKPTQIDSKTLMFEMIEEKQILRIEDMYGNEIYLGWESVSEV